MTLRQAPTRHVVEVIVIVLASAVGGLALFLSAWMGALTVPGINHYPGQREVILQVSVNNTEPLVLTVYMKSNFKTSGVDSASFMIVEDADIEFDDGYLQDENQTVVAQCLRTVPFGSVSDGRGHSVTTFHRMYSAS